jgi:hypothetical protein
MLDTKKIRCWFSGHDWEPATTRTILDRLKSMPQGQVRILCLRCGATRGLTLGEVICTAGCTLLDAWIASLKRKAG